jgi:hypothetical protein
MSLFLIVVSTSLRRALNEAASRQQGAEALRDR